MKVSKEYRESNKAVENYDGRLLLEYKNGPR
jgi:hypothetical protein